MRDLIDSLVATNAQVAPPEQHRRLAVFAWDDDALVGGAFGYTHWQWLFVSHLWVQERHRRRGLGSELLASIEQEGIRRGAFAVHLDTYDFQAPQFYRKHGYGLIGQLDDYPPGHQRHFFAKRLRSLGEPDGPSNQTDS